MDKYDKVLKFCIYVMAIAIVGWAIIATIVMVKQFFPG